MSKITNISYSRSYEIISPIGTIWEKIGIESELSENDIVEEELENLKIVVESFHQKSTSELPPQDTFTTVPVKKQPVKLVPDSATIASYQKFKANGNNAMVQTLEEMYKFPENA